MLSRCRSLLTSHNLPCSIATSSARRSPQSFARSMATTSDDAPPNDIDNKNNNKKSERGVQDLESVLSLLRDDIGESGAQKSNTSRILRNRPRSAASTGTNVNIDVSMLNSELAHVTHTITINASPNNTVITLARPNGDPLATVSGGTAGFKKAHRSGYEAAHQAALQLLERKQTKNWSIKNIDIVLKGFGPGRDAAFRALVADDWNVKRITDGTPIPFGGCRPKKARRL
ncbi:hypothetical protein BCR43DRAFT_484837 [Syncephalastrum racemosum]|uniref:Ribosomal protein S11-domain-containing protein n=1 Tax=Syncephalastrum racemosum TaxID=13706 RepID=A0A1X2HLH3_SYNRA|nr:hypothetical protein BCR43DRAFT_484837 [Syncephalastrum racemosum]